MIADPERLTPASAVAVAVDVIEMRRVRRLPSEELLRRICSDVDRQAWLDAHGVAVAGAAAWAVRECAIKLTGGAAAGQRPAVRPALRAEGGCAEVQMLGLLADQLLPEAPWQLAQIGFGDGRRPASALWAHNDECLFAVAVSRGGEHAAV